MMIPRFLTVLCLWCLLGAFVCQYESAATDQAASPNAEKDDRVSRRDLADSMREQKAMRIVYGSSNASSTSVYQPVAEELANAFPKDWNIKTLPEASVSEAELQDIPLVIVGRQFQNPALNQLLVQLPFQNQDTHFTFHGQTYDQPNLSYRLFLYPHPNSRTPIFLVGGNSDQAILDQLSDNKEKDWGNIFWRSWGYEIYENKQVIVRGNFTDQAWTFNPQNHFDFRALQPLDFNSRHFRFHDLAGLGLPFLEQLAAACEAQIKKICEFTGSSTTIAPVDYYLYPSIEEKGLRLMNSREGQLIKEKREVHVVVNETFQGQHTHQDLQLIFYDLLGAGSKAVLDQGLPASCNAQWQKQGTNYWAARLFQSHNLPPLQELLDDDSFQRESPLVATAAAGALVSYLTEHWGRKVFLDRYRKWAEIDEVALLELEKGWHQYLAGIDTNPTSANSASIPYYRGFNFAHEGYQIYNGYGSKLAQESLAKLHELGTNAVAIVPYGFQRNAKEPTFLSMQHGAGSENDESVILSNAQAQQLGMYTLLKPQLWVSGAWPGEVEMASDADWAEFFDYYYRWIRHYALMAEMYHFDALCVGVEFTKATLNKPEAWRNIIQRLRGIYSGPITYAANWGEEFEQLSFWDEVDFIGLNCYYPLSNDDKPTQKELKKAFAEVLQKAERVSKKHNKPLVFTEVGFRSVQNGWKNPHAEADGRPYDPECQRICYEVLFEGIQDKDWVKGLFLWKWPSYLDHQDDNPVGFTPGGKPAELVVQTWFGGKLGR